MLHILFNALASSRSLMVSQTLSNQSTRLRPFSSRQNKLMASGLLRDEEKQWWTDLGPKRFEAMTLEEMVLNVASTHKGHIATKTEVRTVEKKL
jgi:hypothetical protein